MDALAATIIMPKLVRQESLVGKPSIVMSFPKWPLATAAAVDEGTDLSNTPYTTTENTITVGENGVMTTLTDVAKTSTIGDAASALGRLMGESIARKIDTDLMALFNTLNASTTIGSSGSPLTIAQFDTAIYTCRNNNAKPPFVFAGAPIQASDLRSAILASTGTPFSNVKDSSLNNQMGLGYEFTHEGVDLYTSTLAESLNNGEDRGGVVMARGRNCPIALVTKWKARVEPERDASLRADEIVATANYGVGEVEDLAGVGIVTDL